MEDLNEMARLHSAGATGRHVSPFESLPTHKNDKELTSDFIKKWAVPYYMQIASYGNSKWINTIKEVKPEITKDTCLLLLGDFNWRTRLVGSYFAAVKGYREIIDIIGTHLLKSEVCCVGHIYSLTLAFFNEESCIEYLNRYLDYYLTRPSLYFDQKFVMEAVLFLDKENKTDYFSKHIDKWEALQAERSKIEKRQAQEVAKILRQQEEIKSSEDYLQNLQASEKKKEVFSTEFFEEQIAILRGLNQYS
jgi:hypothetical protein